MATKKFETEIQEIQFKLLFSVPEGYSCFTEKSQDKFLKLLEGNFNVIESGIGFGCFGIKVEVNSPELIESYTKEIKVLAKMVLKLEKIKPPTPPRKKDEYSIVFDLLSKTNFGVNEIYLKQVIYSDDRIFQSLIVKGSCVASRNRMNKIKEDLELNTIIKEIVSFNFGDGALSVTFNQGLSFNENEIINIATKIMNK